MPPKETSSNEPAHYPTVTVGRGRMASRNAAIADNPASSLDVAVAKLTLSDQKKPSSRPSPSPSGAPASNPPKSKSITGSRPSISGLSGDEQEQLLTSFRTISESNSVFADEFKEIADEQCAILTAYKDATRKTTRKVEAFRLSSLRKEDLTRLNVELMEDCIDPSVFLKRVMDILESNPKWQKMQKWFKDNRKNAVATLRFLYSHWATAKEAGCRSLIDPILILVMSMLNSTGAGSPVILPEVVLKGMNGKPFRVDHGNDTSFLSGVVDYFSFNFVGPSTVSRNDSLKEMLTKKNLPDIVEGSKQVLKALSVLKMTTQFAEAKSGSIADLEKAIPQAVGESLIILGNLNIHIVPFTVTNWFGWRFGATLKATQKNQTDRTFTVGEIKLNPDSVGEEEFRQQVEKVFYILTFFALADEESLKQAFGCL